MSRPAAEGSFWDHLDALRSVLVRVLIVVAVLAVASFAAMPWLFEHVIMAPCSPGFATYRAFDAIAALTGASPAEPFSVDIVSLELTSQIFVHLSAAAWTSLIVGFPIIIYILWGFVAPGLYPRERRGAARAFIAGNLMFYLGVTVAYFIIFPLTVRFLSGYSLSSSIRPIVSLESYMDNFFTLLLLMGVVFELPLLAWLLGKAGLLRRSFFSTYRRHAIVVILIISALITPTGDPFTLFLVFIPVYALWEAGARLVPKTTPQTDETNEDETY